MRYIKYFWYILKHKWFVFLECCRLGIPLQGIVHDMSKFLPIEFFPFAEFYYGKEADLNLEVQRRKMTIVGFNLNLDRAWVHHYTNNPHHWEYWIVPTYEKGKPVNHPVSMPEHYVREMISDWHGASRAKGFGIDITNWYNSNLHRFKFHYSTIVKIKAIMNYYYGYVFGKYGSKDEMRIIHKSR